jgi:phage baseplate assembly protein W
MTRPLEGFSFPFRIESGRTSRTDGFEKVKANVRHLLATRLGERPLLRAYGGGVHHRLQEPNNRTLAALVKHEIEQALRVHLPDVKLVGAVGVEAEEAELNISFDYVASPEDLVRRVELTV